MRRLALATAALAAVLAGCPLPQPLPDYPAGTITPPRILMDSLVGDGNPVIFVPAGCTSLAPAYPLSAQVADTNSLETIDARWFVNYDARFTTNSTWVRQDPVPPNSDPTNLTRVVPPAANGVPQYYVFKPYDFPASPGAPDLGHSQAPFPEPNVLRVVELVVSNGFDPSSSSTVLPNRAPQRGFETQAYRWVFLTVPESTSVPCP